VVDEEGQGLDPRNFSEKLFPLNLSSTELQRATPCNPCV
jgi:hypothetical protein